MGKNTCLRRKSRRLLPFKLRAKNRAVIFGLAKPPLRGCASLRLSKLSFFLLFHQGSGKMVRDSISAQNPSKYYPSCSASAYLSTSDKLACRSAMLAGSCTASSTESSLTDRCRPTRPSAEATTPPTPFSARPALASTSLALCLSTWSPPLWVSI